jgi:hypothetical protein
LGFWWCRGVCFQRVRGICRPVIGQFELQDAGSGGTSVPHLNLMQLRRELHSARPPRGGSPRTPPKHHNLKRRPKRPPAGINPRGLKPTPPLPCTGFHCELLHPVAWTYVPSDSAAPDQVFERFRISESFALVRPNYAAKLRNFLRTPISGLRTTAL